MAIKLTKNELKKQKDNLKQFQRYLPTLQLKKQQLQSVIMKIRNELAEKEAERIQMIGDLDDWVAVFAENQLFQEDLKLDKLVQPDTVITRNDNIAGVTIPVFEELTFKDIQYNVDDYPLWVDTAVFKLREIARLDGSRRRTISISRLPALRHSPMTILSGYRVTYRKPKRTSA